MKNVLIVAYDFPFPIEGGNIRIYKFAKYLARHGFFVTIICRARKNSQDSALFSEKEKDKINIIEVGKVRVPQEPNLKQLRNLSFKSIVVKFAKRILIPDSLCYTWNKKVISIAKTCITNSNIDVVITSSPPHSTQLIGRALKRKIPHITWIADMRDLWSESPAFDLGLAHFKSINRLIEKCVYAKADRIIVVSQGIKWLTVEKFKDVSNIEKKITVITNGYDPEDYQLEQNSSSQNANCVFSYVGTIRGPRTHNKLFDALRKINDQGLQFDFIGSFDETITNKAKEIEFVLLKKNVPHADALQIMYNSNVLILILTNDIEGKIAFTGKFFEYLMIGRPILAIVPEGEVSKIVREYGLGEVANPDNEDEIVEAISRLKRKHDKGELKLPENKDFINSFNREKLTKILEELF